MKMHIVAYDLHQHGQNYTCMSKKLKEYPGWCHLQGSVWIVRSNQSPVQIRENLKNCLDANDKLFVATLTGEAAWTGYSNEITNWVKESA